MGKVSVQGGQNQILNVSFSVMQPSYDDLLQIIAEQRQTIDRLTKKVEKLEERLNLKSKNSSKPPSTDQKKNKQSPKGGALKGLQVITEPSIQKSNSLRKSPPDSVNVSIVVVKPYTNYQK